MKKQPKDLTHKEKIETLDALYTTTSTLRGRDEVKAFLRDLLTESERIMLGRRILIAQKLLQNASYSDIQDDLKVGKTTIAKVHRWLEDEFPGYETAVSEMEKRYMQRKTSTFDFAWLRRKYKMHFLLFSIASEIKNRKSK